MALNEHAQIVEDLTAAGVRFPRLNASNELEIYDDAAGTTLLATLSAVVALPSVWYKHSSGPTDTFSNGDRCLFTQLRADNNGSGDVSLNGGTDMIQLAADTGEYEVTVFADTEAPANGDSTSVTVLVDGVGFTIMDIALTGNQVGSWQSLIDTTGAAKTVEVNRAVITGTGRLDVQVKVAGLG